MNKILLTGFAPFDGETSNPSWDAVRALRGRQIEGHRIVTSCLPVEFDTALAQLNKAFDQHRPRLVVCVGLAGGRTALSLERVAINIDDARIADNAGRQPIDCPIVAAGPAAYFSSLPIKAMRAAIIEAGVPAEISQTAGTYVCNHVFYGLMHRLAKHQGVRGGFIHIPYSPEQAATKAGAPSLALEQVVTGLRAGLRCALQTQSDLIASGGALH